MFKKQVPKLASCWLYTWCKCLLLHFWSAAGGAFHVEASCSDRTWFAVIRSTRKQPASGLWKYQSITRIMLSFGTGYSNWAACSGVYAWKFLTGHLPNRLVAVFEICWHLAASPSWLALLGFVLDTAFRNLKVFEMHVHPPYNCHWFVLNVLIFAKVIACRQWLLLIPSKQTTAHFKKTFSVAFEWKCLSQHSMRECPFHRHIIHKFSLDTRNGEKCQKINVDYFHKVDCCCFALFLF